MEVGGKTILQHILEKIQEVDIINEVFLVSNARFYPHFKEWVAAFPYDRPIKVLDDGTSTNETRLGAIADLQFAIEKEKIDDDIMVLAGDNLFDFSLAEFVEFYQEKQTACITTHRIEDISTLKRCGVMTLDDEMRVTSFEEKPQEPKSNMAAPPFYIYQKDTLPLVKKFIDEGQNPDAPGMFIPWLIERKPVHAFEFAGMRYDIGTVESYEMVKELWAEKVLS